MTLSFTSLKAFFQSPAIPQHLFERVVEVTPHNNEVTICVSLNHWLTHYLSGISITGCATSLKPSKKLEITTDQQSFKDLLQCLEERMFQVVEKSGTAV